MSEKQPTKRTAKQHARRVGIGIVGGIVTLAGVIMIPYPGPGWLVVFAGLAILAQEFTWAQRLLDFARSKYDAWVEWLKRQPVWVRIAVLAGTGLVVLVTLYLLNVFGLLANFFNLDIDWVKSPIFG